MVDRKSKIIHSIAIQVVIFVLLAQFGAASDRFSNAPQPIVQASPLQLNLNITLHGMGASFPAPLISLWAQQYHLTHPNVTISYKSVGSGAGQRSLFNKTSDFPASDAPLQPAQRPLAPNVLHIPETIGSVTAAYNLPGIAVGLNFTGNVLANIYLGIVTKWNDPQIQILNPHIILPNQNISIAHRSDGSGTTFVWTSFLCLSSATWCSTVGASTSVNWPVGVGASGNLGVATYVNNTAYALGYVELNYALSNHMTYGAIQNPAGSFILPTLTTTAYAVSNSTQALPAGIGDWSQVRLLNAAGTQTYPIASFSYLLIYRELNVIPSMDINETAQAKELVRFLNWVITTGQTYSAGLSYVPLPSGVVAIDQASINAITFTILSTSAHQTFSLSADSTSGWSISTLTVVSGDKVTLLLLSNDGTSHQWYMDFDNNKILDANETNLASPIFSSTTSALNFTFIATVWSQTGIPSTGSFTYRDSFHNTNSGTINILPQQTAAVLHPASSLTSPFALSIDSSRVTTVGTLLVNTRNQTVSGNVTVTAVDKTSGSITFTKTYAVPALATRLVSTTSQARILFNVAVLPYVLSSNILVQYQALASSTTASAAVSSLTRNIDLDGSGVVGIVDLSVVAFHYGAILGQSTYLATADLNGDGAINIIDLGLSGINYNAREFY